MMQQTAPREIETKATGDEVAHAFDEFMRAFEAFKEANDERLEQIEERISADVVTTEKLNRVNKAIDDHKSLMDALALKSGRPPLGGSKPTASATLQHKAAFDAYMRHGQAYELRRLEEKALEVGEGADGGYLVPEETETTVMRSLADISPIRAIAGVRQVSATVYKKPFTIAGAGSGWVGETAARPETTSPTLAELTFPTMELYAMPSATQTLLDDSVVNIDEWLAEEVRIAFAEQEGAAFVTGDGSNKPKGFLDYDTVANGSWEWEKLGYLATGVDGDFAAEDPSDNLVDLVYALRAPYRGNAHWVMNRATQAEIRKIKDGDGNYIWRPGEQAGAARP